MLSILLLAVVGVSQGAAPVGDAIWLHSVSTNSYVTISPVNGNWLAAKNVLSVGANEQFIVEDAGGGYILLKSAVNSNYAKVDAADVKKLKANTTSTTDELAHFEWIDLGDGKIRLRNIANDLYVKPNGGSLVLRASTSSTATDSEFTWGIVGAVDPVVPINNADLNGSGFVDLQDFEILAGQWLNPDCYNIANLNENCGVDTEDLSVLSSKWLTRQPNIVMIFVDDWAWNGSPVAMNDGMANSLFPLLQMPNLSKLAADGMKFQNAYAGAPQCGPSRVCLQTGMTAARSGFTVVMGGRDYYDYNSSYAKFPVVPCGSDGTIDPTATTIPEALRHHGYASAHFGKWHMYSNPDNEGYLAHDGATTNNQGNTNVPGDPKLMFSITERSLAFMQEQVQAQKPFYLQISHYAMHAGRECLPQTRAKYQNLPEVVAYNGGITNPDSLNRKKDPAVWLGMGEDLDGRIGAVLQKLEDLGIAENTYVIVTSDNGYRQKEFDELSGLAQPLHAHKWWVWQGGLRVPMIVTGPDIPAASVCTANVVNYDFLPTFVEWAGGDPTTELPNIDGLSLSGLMRGETPSAKFLNRYLYFHYPHYRTTMPHSAIVSGMDKLIHFYETSVTFPSYDSNMLFDLSADVGEFTNITPGNPTRAHELHDEMIRYFTEVEARIPLVPNPAYDPVVYQNDSKYVDRLRWGPFQGTRPPDNDEQ